MNVLQRAAETDSDGEEETIAKRVRNQNVATRSQQTGYSLRSGNASGGRNLHYRPYTTRKERGIWDEKSRPAGYLDGTKRRVLTNTSSKMAKGDLVYECAGCKQYFSETDITLDHHQDWKTWIFGNAEPNGDGKISSAAAKEAYSDTSNLVAMCQPCNSKKNGPRDKYD
ncbi:MAG: HNH endonuclease [Leptolyngbyaceae cyanobacterium CSU_1_3]|nr:HNH endonuclease [Leptolyngbyaceae cyanobacterium CSU_1_3]